MDESFFPAFGLGVVAALMVFAFGYLIVMNTAHAACTQATGAEKCLLEWRAEQ